MKHAQKITKFTDQKLLDSMNEYFKIIYKNNSISADETNNFLLMYLEYIMRINSLSSENYDIDIRLVKKLQYEKTEAYLHYLEQHNKFEVYFLRDDMKINRHNNLLYTAAFKKRFRSYGLTNDLALHYFIYKLTISGHEFQHIVQIILNKALYDNYKDQNRMILDYVQRNATEENFDVLAKSSESAIENIDFTHPMEIEANMLSFIYMDKLLNDIVANETDEDYKDFLLNFKKLVKLDREDKISEYEEQHLTRRNLSAYIGLDYDLDVKIPVAKNKGGVII